MNKIDPQPAEDEPLDPAVERVRAKLARLLAVSIGIMFVSVFAVLAAIVWKLNADPVNAFVEGTISLPADFVIAETFAGDGTIGFRGRNGDGTGRILLFDAATGEPRAGLALETGGGVPAD